jgi:hypothetical protein
MENVTTLVDRKDETKEIFSTFTAFKKRITRIFRDIDAKRTAERILASLKQTKSAATYAAEFQ